MTARRAVAALSALARLGGSSALLSSEPVRPPLEPASDRVFFGADYPHDLRPVSKADFGFPFPTVQDSEDYDKDYVKDENQDNGEWKHQQKYDVLRGRLAQARAAAAKAQDDQYSSARKMEADEAKHREAATKAEAALKAKVAAEDRAAKKVEAAQDRYDKAAGKTSEGVGVAKATKEVEQRVKELADCQKELADARKKLQEMQEERERAEAVQREAQAKEKKADAKALEYERSEAKAEGEVDKEVTEYNKAHEKYEHESKQVWNDKAEFVRAEAKLRQYRQKADAGGGVYPAAATRLGPAAAAGWLLVALAALA